jgi:D-alanyl-D-alanine dipeptidase
MQFRIRCFLFTGLFSWGLIGQTLPEGFVFLNEQIPDLEVSLRYATTDNFTGRIVNGYHPQQKVIGTAALGSSIEKRHNQN